MQQHLNMPYVTDSPSPAAHQFDLYVPENSAGQPLVCFIHGGAWRSEDKSDHAETAQKFATFTGFSVAVPNYRLTPKAPTETDFLHHPAHANDILTFLIFITSMKEHSEEQWRSFNPSQICLVGHSCGAHIISSIMLNSQNPSLTTPPSVLLSVKSIALTEGIYDLDKLLISFPGYREFFIDNTFGSLDSYHDFSVTNFPLREKGIHIRWLIIQSKGDTLIDEVQAESFVKHLSVAYASAGLNKTTQVLYNTTGLTADHDAIFVETNYTEIIGGFFREMS